MEEGENNLYNETRLSPSDYAEMDSKYEEWKEKQAQKQKGKPFLWIGIIVALVGVFLCISEFSNHNTSSWIVLYIMIAIIGIVLIFMGGLVMRTGCSVGEAMSKVAEVLSKKSKFKLCFKSNWKSSSFVLY